MIKRKLRDHIKWLVRESGISSTSLLAACATEYIELSMEDIREELLNMIHDKEIFEIEYIINGKSKSFFLPIGTEIRIVK